MSTLSEILRQSQDLEQAIIEAGGELSPQMAEALIAVDLNLADKVDATDVMFTRLEMAASYWSTKAEQYKRISKGLEGAQKQLKEHVKAVMLASGKTEAAGIDVRFKLQKTRAALVLDESVPLSDGYTKTTVLISPDQEKIRTDLELGVPVAGATLKPSWALRSYATKRTPEFQYQYPQTSKRGESDEK